jgi:DNA-binding PadR family transcriptional regulator
MALRHVLLGLLTADHASGYELSHSFARPPWRYLWHAQASQIYAELQEMEASGVITEVARGRRRRRTYGITRTGEAELQKWLTHPPVQFGVRNELALRLLLIASVDPAAARVLLAPFVVESARDLKRLRVAAAGMAPRDARGSVTFERLAAELSLRSVEAMHQWASWMLAELADG